MYTILVFTTNLTSYMNTIVQKELFIDNFNCNGNYDVPLFINYQYYTNEKNYCK